MRIPTPQSSRILIQKKIESSSLVQRFGKQTKTIKEKKKATENGK